jgi:hypothetical protein
VVRSRARAATVSGAAPAAFDDLEAAEGDTAQLAAADPQGDGEGGQGEEVGRVGDDAGVEAEAAQHAGGGGGDRGAQLDGGEGDGGGGGGGVQLPAAQAEVDRGTEAGGGQQGQVEGGGEQKREEGQAGDVTQLAGEPAGSGRGLEQPVVGDQHADGRQGDRMEQLPEGQGALPRAVVAGKKAVDSQ